MKLQQLQHRVRPMPLSQLASQEHEQGRVGTTAQRRLRGRALQARNARIATRDFYTCKICGRVADRVGEGQVDHRVPLAQGGTEDDANLQWLCVDCHRAKTNREKAQR